MDSPADRSTASRRRWRFPARATRRERRRIGELLRTEAVGGMLLVGMAVVALVWANSPWADFYFALRDFRIGIAAWHLELSLGEWAADGLLAVFFFLVGLELKRELVAGELRRLSSAVVPIAAAAGGVAVPALIYLAIAGADPALVHGWAIPTATDIAFAVAVLAVIGSHLPSSLRLFLLTLAVVDDLIAIGIIAIAYTDGIRPLPLVLALACIVIYGVLAQALRGFFVRRQLAAWLILLPIGVVAWGFMHVSGIHATIAGVLLGFTIPVVHRRADRLADERPGLAEVFEHRFRPLSAGIAVPVFAFFSAGVAVGGARGLGGMLTDTVALAIIAALVFGKPVGILAATWFTTRIARIRLARGLRWVDLLGVGMLGGIGFTVSLLVTELAFPGGGLEHDHAKAAILTASLLAAVFASTVLIARNRHYRKLAARENRAGG